MKTLFLSFLLSVFCVSIYAQNIFERRYSYNSNNDRATGIVALPNGHSLVTGYVSDGINHPYPFLMELDATGGTVWSKKYTSASPQNLWARALHATDDGFIVAGDTQDDNDSQFFVMKVNGQGNVQYVRFFDTFPGYLLLSDLDVAPSGNVYLAGTKANGNGSTDIIFFKLSVSGYLQYSQKISQPNVSLTGADIQCTADGGFILCGGRQVPDDTGEGKAGVVLLKFNASGGLDWSKSYKNTYGSWGKSVIQTADNGFMVCGKGISRTHLLKISAGGALEWNRQMTSGEGNDVVQQSDGSFLVSGSSGVAGSGLLGFKMLLTKISATGTVLWNKYYGETGYVEGYNIAQATDGGLLMTGVSAVQSDIDVYVVKTDTTGNVPCNVLDYSVTAAPDDFIEDTLDVTPSNISFTETIPVFQVSTLNPVSPAPCYAAVDPSDLPLSVSVYPNPSTGIFYVEGGGPNQRLEIIDLSGRSVTTFVNSTFFDLTGYPDGVYFVRIYAEAFSTVHKIIVQH